MQYIHYSRINRTPARITSERQRKIAARRRLERLERIKNIILIALLIGCILAAGALDADCIQRGIC